MNPPNQNPAGPAGGPAANPQAPQAAAQAPVLNLAQLTQSLSKIQLDNRIKLLKSNIRQFNGEGESRFRDWLNDMTRTHTVNAATDEEMRMLAMATLTDVAADFVSRGIQENPAVSWQAIRHRMIGRYSDDADAMVARTKLVQMEQNKSETVQNFGERIFKQAKLAYPNVDVANDPVVQGVLVDILANGAKEYAVGRALRRKKPATFDRAVDVAAEEQAVQRSCKMLKKHTPAREEPMEVDSLQHAEGAAASADQQGKLDVLIEAVSTLVKHQAYRSQNQPKVTPKFDEQGRPICLKCGLPGHIARHCRGIPKGKDLND